jgi:uncharacterized coiled-coil DUF342 family protein
MAADPTLLRRLLASVDAADQVDVTERKLNTILKALELLLRLSDLQRAQMSALTDNLAAQIDRLAARLAEASGVLESLAVLQQEKAATEAQLAELRAQQDEHSQALQDVFNRVAWF